MSYSLITLWHERRRYLPGILAVGFSALLIALQCGLLLGLFSITSIPIDHSKADLWIGSPQVLAVDLGRPIPTSLRSRIASIPGVQPPEQFIEGFSVWNKPTGGSDLCLVIGCRLGDDSLGAISELTSELRAKLTEPGTIVIDESELGRLGLTNGIDETVEIGGQRVRIVGLVRGLKGIAAPYVFCSVRTARPLLRMAENQTTFLLARCDNPKLADAAARRLKAYSDMSAYTAREFSLRSRMHWLTKTKAGIALGYTALLGLLVGGVVTSQTLYAATAASLREYAVLRALGIPRWRMSAMVLAQSFWVGLAGNLLAVGPAFFFAWVADVVGVKVMLPGWLLAASLGITMFMAMISGLAALRSLRLSEPAILLR